jgi:tetratricopeptide (TPR) repeat protein/TolB-like protein
MIAPARRARKSLLVLAAVLAGLLPALDAAAQAPAKHRTVLILPFQTIDVTRDERWFGEGVAESVTLALIHVPGLIQVDRQRLARVPQPESWDDAGALAAGRALRADIVVYGEVKRTAAELTLAPKVLEIRGERADRTALDVAVIPEGAFFERVREVPVAVVRAVKAPLSEADANRLRKAASPTTSLRAYEAFVRGQVAGGRPGKDAQETAVEHLARAVELDPQFVAAQYTLGAAHHALGNRWKAAAQFRAASQLDPTYAEPLKALGDIFISGPRRLFAEAVEAYTKAIDLRPFFADAHVGLGDARAAKGEIDAAIASYQKALSHNPLNPRVHASLGRIYFTEKSLYFEAVNAYKKAIDLDPADVDARMGLAEVYEDKGLYTEAVAEYKTVVTQDPKHTGALYNLALVYEKVDPKESIALWERYISLAGPQPSEKDWVDVAKLHLRKLRNQFPQ